MTSESPLSLTKGQLQINYGQFVHEGLFLKDKEEQDKFLEKLQQQFDGLNVQVNQINVPDIDKLEADVAKNTKDISNNSTLISKLTTKVDTLTGNLDKVANRTDAPLNVTVTEVDKDNVKVTWTSPARAKSFLVLFGPDTQLPHDPPPYDSTNCEYSAKPEIILNRSDFYFLNGEDDKITVYVQAYPFVPSDGEPVLALIKRHYEGSNFSVEKVFTMPKGEQNG